MEVVIDSFNKGKDVMDSNIHLLDEMTRRQLVGEMSKLNFDDTAAAVRHFAYLAKSGKRFSRDDVVTIFGAAGMNTERVPNALADLATSQTLESYPKDGTIAYFMERGARIDYGDKLGRPSRDPRWSPSGVTQATS
jgi:hypothetical protein